jgi:hypothetical protein
LTFNGLHSVISQKIEVFIITAVRTSNPNVENAAEPILGFNSGIKVKGLTKKADAFS